MPDQSTKIKKTFNYLIQLVIIVVTYGFIYRQVFVERKLQEIPGLFSRIMDQENSWLWVVLLMVLMVVNWGLESAKWKKLIGKIEEIPFWRAYMGVLTGVSVSLFTPNRTGDYLGRVFILKKGNPFEAILITMIGSFAQVITTLSVGLLCFLAFSDQYLRVTYRVSDYLISGMILLVPTVVFLVLLFYFNIRVLSDILQRYLPGRREKWKGYFRVFSLYSSEELFHILLLSIVRYIVYSSQFLILLKLFGTDLPLSQGMMFIPVIFLIMAVIPSIALTDLGIRGSVSMFVVGIYFKKNGTYLPDTDLAILAASSLLWLINLVIPAILGTFFVFSLKFFRR